MGAQCRALHLDEAKRVRDVSLMTQTQTSRRMHYRKRVTGWDSNPTSYYILPRRGRLDTKGGKILSHRMEKVGRKMSAGHTQISFGNIFQGSRQGLKGGG